MTEQFDPDTLPAMRNLSAAFMQRLVLVPATRPTHREYVYVSVPRQPDEARGQAMGFFTQWSMAWESGSHRISYFGPEELRKYVPEAVAARLEQDTDAHELAVKTLDFSPASVRDRRAAGRRDMGSGLALLRTGPAPKGRFDYVPVDSEDARAAAEAGAAGTAALPLGKVA